jgi:hypothetical protein
VHTKTTSKFGPSSSFSALFFSSRSKFRPIDTTVLNLQSADATGFVRFSWSHWCKIVVFFKGCSYLCAKPFLPVPRILQRSRQWKSAPYGARMPYQRVPGETKNCVPASFSEKNEWNKIFGVTDVCGSGSAVHKRPWAANYCKTKRDLFFPIKYHSKPFSWPSILTATRITVTNVTAIHLRRGRDDDSPANWHRWSSRIINIAIRFCILF